jgi:hypothetical protein
MKSQVIVTVSIVKAVTVPWSPPISIQMLPGDRPPRGLGEFQLDLLRQPGGIELFGPVAGPELQGAAPGTDQPHRDAAEAPSPRLFVLGTV